MKTLLMWLFCPRYFADMPKDGESGPWVAVAIRHSLGRREEYIWQLVSGDLRAAYKMARWLALKADFALGLETRGIEWAVRRPSEQEEETFATEAK